MDMVDPKPWLEHGPMGAGVLLLFLNMVFSVWLVTQGLKLFRELIPILENLKGYLRALLEKDPKENTRRRT